MRKKIINYLVNYYPCNVTINGRWFLELEISQYYRTKPGRSTVSDEVIIELVKQLPNRPFRKDKNDYYNFEPLYIGYRAYNLVWDYDESPFATALLIIDCYREAKFDKKK